MSRLLALAMASSLPLAALADFPIADMQASQLVFDATQPIVMARINPVLSPGVNSLTCGSNLVVGPNNVNSNSTSDQLRGGTCTSMAIGGTAYDMSAYSTPHMYYQSSSGTFTPLKLNNVTIFYNLYSSAALTAFPDDFSLSAGNQRGFDPSCGQAGHDNPGGHFFSDAGTSASIPQQYSSVIGTTLVFPDCWDGQAFSQATQGQHMAYSAQTAGFPCPPGFPKKFPQIVMQVSYSTGPQSQFGTNPNGATYVLSNGDATGCSLHGSFVNGWLPNVLNNVISQCGKLGAGNTAQCSAIKVSDASTTQAGQCRYGPDIPQEDIGLTAPISTLAGCLTAGGRAKNCNSASAFGAPNGFDTNYRAGGLPYWSPNKPSAPAPSSSSTTTGKTTTTTTTSKTTSTSKTPTPSATTSGHTLFGCTAVNWGGSCVNVNFAMGVCLSLKTPFNGVNLYHNMRSSGTDDAVQCTLYDSDTCSASSQNWVLPKGGTANFGQSSAHWGSVSCHLR